MKGGRQLRQILKVGAVIIRRKKDALAKLRQRRLIRLEGYLTIVKQVSEMHYYGIEFRGVELPRRCLGDASIKGRESSEIWRIGFLERFKPIQEVPMVVEIELPLSLN